MNEGMQVGRVDLPSYGPDRSASASLAAEIARVPYHGRAVVGALDKDRQSEVFDEINVTEEYLEALSMEIARLMEHLSPITFVAPEAEPKPMEPQRQTPVGGRMARNNQKLSDIIRSVRGIRDSLRL